MSQIRFRCGYELVISFVLRVLQKTKVKIWLRKPAYPIISRNPHVCCIYVLILISLFLRYYTSVLPHNFVGEGFVYVVGWSFPCVCWGGDCLFLSYGAM